MSTEVDLNVKLPEEILRRIAELDLELAEGDITQKGYEKKKTQLLAPFVPAKNASQPQVLKTQASPSTRANRRHQRRATRDENRYHSEIRVEAVQQALAQYGKAAPSRLPVLAPVKRPSYITSANHNNRYKNEKMVRRSKDKRLSDSSSDDDSLMNSSGDSSGRKKNNENISSSANSSKMISNQTPPHLQDKAKKSSYSSPLQQQPPYHLKYTNSNLTHHFSPVSEEEANFSNNNNNQTKITKSDQKRVPQNQNIRPPPPDVTNNVSIIQYRNYNNQRGLASNNDNRNSIQDSAKQRSYANGQRNSGVSFGSPNSISNKIPPGTTAVRNRSFDDSLSSGAIEFDSPSKFAESFYVNNNNDSKDLADDNFYQNSELQSDYQNAVLKPPKVSQKIQQLLNTLQRPKKKPLHEYYNDDEAELEILAKIVDPNAPKPEGAIVCPAKGEPIQLPSTLPRTLESALQIFGSANHRHPVATVLDPAGTKLPATLTYGKLFSRATKIAYTLLTKLTNKIDPPLKAGDRIALVYPNNDPISFIVAFYGCQFAGLVPVPLDVPLTKRDAGIQQLGFLLGSCQVRVALTSEACLKGLPKANTIGQPDIVDLKGWPPLAWVIAEHLPRPPKDWLPPARLTDETVAYIEYTTGKEGSVKGVCISKAAMLAHCRALTAACDYQEGDSMVCVLDFKREVGFWHSVIANVYNGMHCIFIPYALMKVNPSSWMQMITKHKASVALAKSRDLHWGLLAGRDQKDISLSSLRMLIVADGANPWSLSSCDQFVNTFQSKGLRSDVLCPCAYSPETLTVSIRRPGRTSAGNAGRGVLSMSALSYGVVRVDQENSLTSLTLQDAGQVLPGTIAAVVKLSGPPKLCKADEIGEICLFGPSSANGYWGLEGLSSSIFKVGPLGADDRPSGAVQFIRSGLIGFMGPGSLIFVCGTKNGLMNVSGRQHNADDIIATVLAVEPMKFVYRGRIVVFSVNVLRDERICIIAEQKADATEEECFQWMSRVLQAIDSIHQVGIYCLALVLPNQLPKTALGGIHVSEARQKFLDGCLNPSNLLMCPHTCVTNLPKPREIQLDIGPAAMFVGNIVQGARISGAQGRDLILTEEDKVIYLSDILRMRASQSPDNVLYTMVNAKGTESITLTSGNLHRKSEKIGALLLERGHLNAGDHVALIFAPGIDLVCALYGCLYIGVVPVCVRPPHPQNLQTTLPTVRMIIDVSKSVAILSTSSIIRLLRSKEASNRVDAKAWPTILDIEEAKSKRLSSYHKPESPDSMCYLDFSVSTTGMLAGIKMSFSSVLLICKSLKLACELYPSRHICLCLDPYSGLGFILWCMASVYAGHHSIIVPPAEVEANPALWLSTVSQHKVRDTFCSYGVMELCVRELALQVEQLKERCVNLSCLRTCVVVAEERPRVALCNAFTKLFAPLCLSSRAVSTSFGCRVNIAVCMQGASSPDPCTVYVDTKALRNDRVTLVEKGAPHSIPLMESGKLLPGVKVVIANPDTRGQCADSHLGEIWVSSMFNSSGYFTVYGEETSLHDDHFNARLTTGDTRATYARTGYLGFLRQTQSVTADGELHDALFVVGARDETLILYGMRYHPVDIETSVLRAHKKICECAVFTWTNLLVVVAELDGPENEALNLVPLITTSVLEDHHHIVGVVVVVDPGTVPINSRGEKQRMHLRDAFLHDQLDPIYVAYNM